MPSPRMECYPETVIRQLALATAMVTALSLSAATAQDIPAPPATFFGTVTVDGERVNEGTPVVALIDGKECGEAEREPGSKGTVKATEARPEYDIKVGDSLYVVDVVSDSQVAGCGTDGATVTFLIAGRPADQTGEWKAGPNVLNLTAGTLPDAGEPVITPAGGQAPATNPSELSGSGGSGFTWWPFAAGGGAGLLAVVTAATLWRARTTARRKGA